MEMEQKGGVGGSDEGHGPGTSLTDWTAAEEQLRFLARYRCSRFPFIALLKLMMRRRGEILRKRIRLEREREPA